MSSSEGTEIKGCNHKTKHNVDASAQRPKFCQSLFYLLPCFKKKVSPSSSRSSSKTSKNNFFLENHYIVKCPKKKGGQNKKDVKKQSEVKNVERLGESSDCTALEEVCRLPNQKEVRFIGAAKRHSDRNDYLKLLGMEPNDYLNQFSSVFIKNLKSPIPKDPSALPKKCNVYVPPKKKSNRSLLSISQSSNRNVSHCPKPRRSISVNRSISSVVKEKCAAFQKNFEIFKKVDENKKTHINPTSACLLSSDELLGNTTNKLHKYSTKIKNDNSSPWQCVSNGAPYRYCETQKGHFKFKPKKQNLLCEDSHEKQKVKFLDDQSESHVQKLKRYLHINKESLKKDAVFKTKDVDDGCSRVYHKPKNNSSEDSVAYQPSDRNPWPRHNFLQLHAINGSTNMFRGAAVTNHKLPDNDHGKTLIWKLLIKNQKEYIHS